MTKLIDNDDNSQGFVVLGSQLSVYLLRILEAGFAYAKGFCHEAIVGCFNNFIRPMFYLNRGCKVFFFHFMMSCI